MNNQTTRTPYCHKVCYGVTGAPNLTGMDGSYAPGISIDPTLVELVYSAARDGKPATISASVTGWWMRDGARVQPEAQVAVHFKDGPGGWPGWLAEEAWLHAPDAVRCICEHAKRQHFEDACLACDCGDYLEPEAAREVIARWRESAAQKGAMADDPTGDGPGPRLPDHTVNEEEAPSSAPSATVPPPVSRADAELASLAMNAGRALSDEKRHYEIACQENARLRATIDRVRRLHDNLNEETALTSPDDEITRGAAARKIAAALDGWTDPAELRRMADEVTAEHHTVDGTRYLCHTDDHYCPDRQRRKADEAQPGTEAPKPRCTCNYIAEPWMKMDHATDCPARPVTPMDPINILGIEQPVGPATDDEARPLPSPAETAGGGE